MATSSIFSKLPQEIIVAIVQYLESAEIFQLRDIIAEFHTRLVLYEAICKDETHPPSTSARRPLKELGNSDKELDEREALYLQHRNGWPIRRVCDIRNFQCTSDYWSIYAWVCQHSIFAYIAQGMEGAEPDILCLHNLSTQQYGFVHASYSFRYVAVSDKIVAFASIEEVFILPREHIEESGNAWQLEDSGHLRRELLKEDHTLEDFRITSLACHEDYVAAVSQGHHHGKKYIHIIKDEVTSFEMPDSQVHVELSGNSGHYLVFEGAYLWHIYATELSSEDPRDLLKFQCFTMDGQLHHQWQHIYKAESNMASHKKWDIQITSTGKDWQITFTRPHRGSALNGINFVVDLSKEEIRRLPDGNFRIWKDIVYKFKDQVEAARTVGNDFGEPFLGLGLHGVQDVLVDDSYFITITRNNGSSSWEAYTFDNALAPDGMKMIAVFDEIKEGYGTFEEEWSYREWQEKELLKSENEQVSLKPSPQDAPE